MKNFEDKQGETTELGRKYGSLDFRSQAKGRFQKVIVLNTMKDFKHNVQGSCKGSIIFRNLLIILEVDRAFTLREWYCSVF